METRNFKKPGGTPQGTVPPSAVSSVNPGHSGDTTISNESESPPSEIKDYEPQEDEVITSYLDYLKEHDISKTDVFSVLESILTVGEVYWQFDLLGKVPVVFKMRPAWINDKLMEKLDHDPPKSQARFISLVNTYNLAGSLVKHGDYQVEVATSEDLEANLNYINNLPYIIQNRLVKQMAIFDRVIAVATSEWAIENFTEPLSEE